MFWTVLNRFLLPIQADFLSFLSGLVPKINIYNNELKNAHGEMYRNNAFTVVTDAQEIKGKYDTFLSNKQVREVSRNEEKNICNNYHLLNQYYASCRLRKYHRSF